VIGRLLLGALIVAALVTLAVLLRHVRRPQRRGRAEALSEKNADAQDRFRTAAELAARGDFDGAVRELALAVAMRVTGPERSDLSVSPLTVREIYRASGDYIQLRPLLLAFEESFYGHHPVGEERYRAVLAVAIRYRGLVVEAA
jgi:hypothetical protein